MPNDAEFWNDLSPETLAIHADKFVSETTSLAPPIFQTSTFSSRSPEEFNEMATAPQHTHFYTRYGNPTHAHAQAVIAALEKADGALLTGSGMGATTTIALSLLSGGAHVVAQKVHYGGTIGLFEKLLPKFGVETTFVDQTDPAAFEAALRPNTRLIVVETPTNPMMLITDLRAVADLAKARGITTIADNTFATPVNQRPLDFGIDLVFHSATKYLGGHHDLIAGVIAGGSALIEQLWRTSLTVGAALNAFDSWLLLRGLRTLRLRVEKHNLNGLVVARALAAHPRIAAVYYPGLENHPQHALACAQMSGFTGMLSFEIDGDYKTAEQFLSRLRLVDRAASLGGIHTLAVQPAAMLAGTMSEEQFRAHGVPPSLIRLSVGLENPDDIIKDLLSALEQV